VEGDGERESGSKREPERASERRESARAQRARESVGGERALTKGAQKGWERERARERASGSANKLASTCERERDKKKVYLAR
jgi:hypothetical protein